MIHQLETNQLDQQKTQITGDHKRFNAFLRGLEGQPLWTPGDFLVHFAGVYDPKEIDRLTDAILRGEVPRLAM